MRSAAEGVREIAIAKEKRNAVGLDTIKLNAKSVEWFQYFKRTIEHYFVMD